MLKDKKIGLFITGGIAAYKMAELSRQLIKKGAQVRVVMSRSAQAFLSPLTMQTLTKAPVLVDTFDEREPSQVQHVYMADWCDYALVAPATANILAKMAHGIADEIVSTTLLALHCPRLIVPAMNTNMYLNPATSHNLKTLSTYGYEVMEPATGFLAEGYEGIGRLPDLDKIVAHLELLIARTSLPQVMEGKSLLVSAGGTQERLDPVRYLTNDSTGKMGYALAQAGLYIGAQVTLVSTTDRLPVPLEARYIQVKTAQEMERVMTEEAHQADYIVMAAAVSDYRPEVEAKQKLKKEAGQKGLSLHLVENPDILKGLGESKTPGQVVVGFAAETHQVLNFAHAKLEKKSVDWIVANDVSDKTIGFNSEQNQVTLIGKGNQVIDLPRGSKLEVAFKILETIVEAKKDFKG